MQLYLNESTRKTLTEKCQDVLIRAHSNAIQDEFQTLLDQDKVDDLTRMYGLLSRIPDTLVKLREVFESHVRRQGVAAVEKVAEAAASGAAGGDDEEGGDDDDEAPKKSKTVSKKKSSGDADPKVYVDALLSVQVKYSDMVNAAFKSEPGFVESLDKACKEYVNRNAVCKSRTSMSPELLAKYCDSLLKKSSKVAEDAEIEEVLTRIVRHLCLSIKSSNDV